MLTRERADQFIAHCDAAGAERKLRDDERTALEFAAEIMRLHGYIKAVAARHEKQCAAWSAQVRPMFTELLELRMDVATKDRLLASAGIDDVTNDQEDSPDADRLERDD